MTPPTGWTPPEQPPGWAPPPGGSAGGWAPVGWGQPPAYPPPWVHRRPTNTLAVISLVLAFVFSPAALVTGIIARRQIARTGEEGSGLALAGIILGALGTALFVALLVAWVVAVSMLAGASFGP